jgi:predicted nucleic acid-binding protein
VRALLDANVLFPTVLREILLAVAARGVFVPLWSARLLEEWARATVKLGPGAEDVARGEIALLRAAWPAAEVAPAPSVEARLWLPDPDDVHVLAAAIAGSADLIVTFNAGDFPRATLAEEGLERQDPDQFLCALHVRHPADVAAAVADVAATARRLSGEELPLRPLLKRARLPRLGRRLA